jgi:hypothetical protein
MRLIALPLVVQTRMLAYFDFRLQEKFYKDFEILNELGPQLKRKIKLHLGERLLKSVQLFQALPGDVITRLVDCLDSQIYLKNDVIMKAEQTELVSDVGLWPLAVWEHPVFRLCSSLSAER